jgi:TatA/E family protein of Tat protein translocase
VFDLSIWKLLVLAVIALVIFGPNELPKIASQAGRALRDLRKIAEGAKNDLREGLGPEFSEFEFEDLNTFSTTSTGARRLPPPRRPPSRLRRTVRCSPRASAPRSTPTRPEPV